MLKTTVSSFVGDCRAAEILSMQQHMMACPRGQKQDSEGAFVFYLPWNDQSLTLPTALPYRPGQMYSGGPHQLKGFANYTVTSCSPSRKRVVTVVPNEQEMKR